MRIKVLVVEDDFLIADDYTQTIEMRGWEVLGPAPTCERGLKLLMAERPTVAILDVTLRHGVSTPVAEELLVKRIPFIVASGGADPIVVGGEAFRGITNLGKPNSPASLIEALETALRNHAD